MGKNAFTLFEVILSLFILSVTLTSVSKIFAQSGSYEIYNKLVVMENSFTKNKTVENTGDIVFK